MTAYLDNSATTPVCPQAVDAVTAAVRDYWGNPSSLHAKGIEADGILADARETIARRLFCRPDEIYFTSGGTESNNLALRGAAHAMRRRGRRIVTTNVEHPSVDETLKQLEKEGFEVIRLPVDSTGRINERDLFRAVTPDTILISLMAVNNETGTIQPIEQARLAARRNGSPAIIHCDAVQAFGKLPLKPAALGIDMMTISSHKVHGPKGVGALYIRKGVKINPLVFGGSQEDKIRPGTQPMPAIAGFGAAVKAIPNISEELENVTWLRNYMCMRLSALDGVVLNSPPDALPYVTNISVLGINSEPMLNFLSARGIYVSSGSACAKGHSSPVLKSMGLSEERRKSPLRISFSRFTTKEEIDMLVDGIAAGQKAIRKNK
ncbi:MAG: cysteine desulfurase [Clostridia bacterium]|nr:cysteine desulfurase [Clostridia bacterium]